MNATVDMAALSAQHTSPQTAQRTKNRHRAEWRLKLYGILAICLAAAALLLLVSTIVQKTANMVYEYYVELETTIELSDRDAQRLDDPNPRMRANLDGLVREALVAAVPGEVGRSDLRQLVGLRSGDAGLELGDMVKADRSLEGQTITFEALLDDDTQLYLKGAYGELEPLTSTGDLRITRPEGGEDGAIELDMGPTALSAAFQYVRDQRTADALRERAEARRQDNAVQVTERRLLEAETDEARAEYTRQLEGFTAARDAANQRANALLQQAINKQDAVFEMTERDVSVLVQANGGWIKVTKLEREHLEGIVYAPLETDQTAAEGTWQAWIFETSESIRPINDRQIVWLRGFQEDGKIVSQFNERLLFKSDSSNAELAGIWGALVGSFWTMIVTFLLAFPIGVMASIYLEEFAPKNRITDLIEVNINNLAAVPSIVFGLLGLAIFVAGVNLNIFGTEIMIGGFLPRSSPLAGGAVLALMTLPTIIIAGRASIRAVPPSIRDAALGLGASRLQTATHHVLPLAMPGILTGSIIGMAQALGETAPLLLIGMNSFIQEPPATPLNPGTVLPALIYQWNNNSERLFDDKTAAAISVLLIFLVLMNALAVLLRKRFERRW